MSGPVGVTFGSVGPPLVMNTWSSPSTAMPCGPMPLVFPGVLAIDGSLSMMRNWRPQRLTSVTAPVAPMHAGPSPPAKHRSLPPAPASATNRSPREPKARWRGLTSPEATTWMAGPEPPPCAWAAGAPPSTASSTTDSNRSTRKGSLLGGGFRKRQTFQSRRAAIKGAGHNAPVRLRICQGRVVPRGDANIGRMELRHLRYFVAVAEELHFRRAAERLHMSQPPLSQQIRQLEEEIGATLLLRNQRKVELTAAGAAFLVRAREILDAVEDAARQARRVQRGEVGRLAVGFVGSAMYSVVPER